MKRQYFPKWKQLKMSDIEKIENHLLSLCHLHYKSGMNEAFFGQNNSYAKKLDGQIHRKRNELLQAIQDYARGHGHAGVLIGADVVRKKEGRE